MIAFADPTDVQLVEKDTDQVLGVHIIGGFRRYDPRPRPLTCRTKCWGDDCLGSLGDGVSSFRRGHRQNMSRSPDII